MIANRIAPLVLAVLAASSSACSKHVDPAEVAEFSAFKDPDSAPEALRTAAQAVVRIATANAYATGSFISDDGLLLTNNHVLGVDVCPIEGCFARITRMHQRHQSPEAAETVFFEPLHVNVGLDMAILQGYSVTPSGAKGAKLTTPQFLTFDARDAASLEGTRVNVIGHPEGRLKKWTTGEVVDSSGAWFESTAFTLPGNSGSPILSDDGKIVGLLHRGPTGEDLVTRRGVNVYSIGTTSAAIVAAMNDPLPATVRSILKGTTDDEVVKHETVFRNARVTSANVNGASKDVLVSLADACDKGLARTDYASPEDLTDAIGPCNDASAWINCHATPGDGSFGVCPSDADKTLWSKRFQGVVDHWRALNGSLELEAITFAQAALAPTEAKGQQVAADNLQVALAAAQPPLDFGLATYLAAFGVDAYGGTRMVDFVRGYAKVPHYELATFNIVLTALWLNKAGTLPGPDTVNILSELAQDEKVSLGPRLYIEEIQYNSKLIN